jgi:hypothetical protein
MNILETIEDNVFASIIIFFAVAFFVSVIGSQYKSYNDAQVAKEAIKAGLEQNDKGLWVKKTDSKDKVIEKETK